ncbi:MAG TPA: Ig-like domain-containing protein [Terracidiphilus sp.]|nr:Ig-like domain-containing protein [Terracidiphilus sp.]
MRDSSGDLEQVHVRGMNRRSLRLELVAGLGLALLVLPMAAAGAQGVSNVVSTQTSLTVTTSDQSGQTKAAVAVSVAGADGQPATGAVAINEGGRQLAQVVLNAMGQATTVLALPGGMHNLSAVYSGDSTHQSSVSLLASVQGQTSTAPSFQLTLAAVSPSALPLVLTAGAAGTVNVTINPVNPTALTSPMFVTLSCSGLPNQASCTFSPGSVEILPNTPTSCPSGSPASACPPVSSMVLQTQSAGTVGFAAPASHTGKGSDPVAWAILLPGVLSLGGLAWGARRRAWLSRLSLLALVGLVTMLGTTACNPRYFYFNHGPPNNLPTPAGTYTVTVTGQSSDGVTAITQSTPMVLTVQ